MATPSATNRGRASVREIILQETPSVGNPPPTTSEVRAGDGDPEANDDDSPKKKKYDTRFKQQRHIAIRQEYSFKSMICFFMVLGAVLICIGLLCKRSADGVPTPIRKYYTTCPSKKSCFKSNCTCNVTIDITEDIANSESEIILYYELTNFIQNTRKYKKDVDWKQLGGNIRDPKIQEEVDKIKCTTGNRKNGEPLRYPCGKIANSMFNDVFKKMSRKDDGRVVTLDSKNIAWEADLKRFKNPPKSNWSNIWKDYTFPRDWRKEQIQEFFNGSKKGVENEHFIVWMRTATLNVFRKKYAYIKGLQQGKYIIEIDYRFEVRPFKGKKAIVIAADSGTYPVNSFFFYGYIIVGAICLVLGPSFYCVHICIHISSKKKWSFSSQSSVEAPVLEDDGENPKTSQDNLQTENSKEVVQPASSRKSKSNISLISSPSAKPNLVKK